MRARAELEATARLSRRPEGIRAAAMRRGGERAIPGRLGPAPTCSTRRCASAAELIGARLAAFDGERVCTGAWNISAIVVAPDAAIGVSRGPFQLRCHRGESRFLGIRGGEVTTSECLRLLSRRPARRWSLAGRHHDRRGSSAARYMSRSSPFTSADRGSNRFLRRYSGLVRRVANAGASSSIWQGGRRDARSPRSPAAGASALRSLRVLQACDSVLASQRRRRSALAPPVWA